MLSRSAKPIALSSRFLPQSRLVRLCRWRRANAWRSAYYLYR